jgi:hypothetical protein
MMKTSADWQSKLPFPRLRLLPGNIVFLEADGSRRYFRLAFRWDGSLRLREKTRPPRRSVLLILHSDIPLRRLFRIPARLRSTRNLLVATVADAFPFDVDEGVFALGERDAQRYAFGLEQSKYEGLKAVVANPAAVLVASTGAPEDVSAAVDAWLRDGPVRDMLAGPRPLRPWALLMGVQALALVGIALFAVDSWVSRNQQLAERQQELLQQTRKEAEPLLAKRRSLFRMVEADRALTDLQQLPGADIATRLGSVIGALPEGTRIDRIRLVGEELQISGWGDTPTDWLADSADTKLDIKDYPKEDRFVLSIDLKP